MKNWLAIIFFLLCTISISAQTELIVELIFEDAPGARDTTFLGISEEACDTSLNQELGEERINPQFSDDLEFKVIGAKAKQDSTFDSNIFNNNLFSQRIFFGFASNNNFQCISGRQAVIFKSRLKNPPLKITWNWVYQDDSYDIFRNDAKLNTRLLFFSGENGSLIIEDFDSEGIRLKNVDSILFQKDDLMLWPGYSDTYLFVFYLLQVVVSTDELNTENIKPVHVFPNPSFDNIRLNMEEPCDQCIIQFYDVNGTLLQAHAWQDADIDITNLPEGMISGLVMEKGIPVASFRFLKMK